MAHSQIGIDYQKIIHLQEMQDVPLKAIFCDN